MTKKRAYHLPEREMVAKAYELVATGLSDGKVAAQVGVSRDRVRVWRTHPERWDPVDDEVALERSLEGDVKVYENLTHFELETFLDRIEERMEIEPLDEMIHIVNSVRPGTRTKWWLHDLEDRLRLARGTLQDQVRQRRRRAA